MYNMLNYMGRWRVGSVFLFFSSHRLSVGLVLTKPSDPFFPKVINIDRSIMIII